MIEQKNPQKYFVCDPPKNISIVSSRYCYNDKISPQLTANCYYNKLMREEADVIYI